MICDFNDTAHSTRDIGVQYEGRLGGGGKEGGGGGGGVESGALLILLAQEDELLLGWLPLVSLLVHNTKINNLDFCKTNAFNQKNQTTPDQLAH